jgi:hypothetical protein
MTVELEWIQTPRLSWKGENAPFVVFAYRLVIDGIPGKVQHVCALPSEISDLFPSAQKDDTSDPLPAFDVATNLRRKERRRLLAGLMR